MWSGDGRAPGTVTELLDPCESRPTSLLQDGIHTAIPLSGWFLGSGVLARISNFVPSRSDGIPYLHLQPLSPDPHRHSAAGLQRQIEAIPLIPRGNTYRSSCGDFISQQ